MCCLSVCQLVCTHVCCQSVCQLVCTHVCCLCISPSVCTHVCCQSGKLKSKLREHMRCCHPELTPADIDELMRTIPPTRRRRATGGKSASSTASLPMMDIQPTVSSQQGTCGTDQLPSSSPSTCSVSVWKYINSFFLHSECLTII